MLLLQLGKTDFCYQNMSTGRLALGVHGSVRTFCLGSGGTDVGSITSRPGDDEEMVIGVRQHIHIHTVRWASVTLPQI